MIEDCRAEGVSRSRIEYEPNINQIAASYGPAGHHPDGGSHRCPSRRLRLPRQKANDGKAGHRGDFERDRADKLLSEALRTTLDLIAAREATARTEGDLAVVRAQAEGEVAAVRAHIERLETELATIRARRRWWRRLRT